MVHLGIENAAYPTLEQVIESFTAPRIRGERPTFCYIIEAGGQPVGHIQAYRVGDYPIYARAIDFDDDAWGIDLFIGEDDMRGGGFGTRALDRFVETGVLFSPRGRGRRHRPQPEQRQGYPLLREGWLHPRQDGLRGDGGRAGVCDGATEIGALDNRGERAIVE